MSSVPSLCRGCLPQLGPLPFLTDGGIETTLIFQEDWELPEFAAFGLLSEPRGITTLHSYFKRYIDIALQHGTGIVLETPTWRASSRWGEVLGYAAADLEMFNRSAVAMLMSLRHSHATEQTPMVISGCIGPQDDGYQPQDRLSVAQAQAYHMPQVQTFGAAGADMVSAITMTYVDEAIGITRAAQSVGLPVSIAFTVETDGRLPTGDSLGEAIRAVDTATNRGPAYYMINCAHTTHFLSELETDEPWRSRIGGVRANASKLSHAELDEAQVLDDGNPVEFGQEYAALMRLLPNLRVLGGCCGTDHRHISEAAAACLPAIQRTKGGAK